MKYLLFLTLIGVVQASQAQESGPYMGFALGLFDYEEDSADLGLTISDTTTAYRLLGGYRFSENFALEGGWGATSDIEESFSGSVPGVGTFTVNVAGDYEIFTVRALGFVPASSVTVFGGVGYYDADLTASVSAPGFGSEEFEDSDSGATLVGGIEFPLERLTIRGELEWFDTDSEVEAWDVSVALLFNF